MKLLTFQGPGQTPLLGALVDEGRKIAALQAANKVLERRERACFGDMLAFLRAGAEARAQAEEAIEIALTQRLPDTLLRSDEVRLLAPLPRPESIRDCMAFEDHIINATRVVGLGRLAAVDKAIERVLGRRYTIARRVNRAWYERPLYYKSNRFSVIGPEDDVVMPRYAETLDYELEWGIVIGKEGRDIPESRARDHIAGFTIFNDFSAREVQMREMAGRLGPAKGKDFDTGNAIGPWLVTPDEIPEPYGLAMTARVNGEVWSRGNTADMHWSFERIISHVSQSETLYPGEFIGSGTCSGAEGSGCGLEIGRRLVAGDVVELEVQGLGVLRNRLVPTPVRPVDPDR